MPTLESLRLRASLAAAQDGNDPHSVLIWDRQGVTRVWLRVTMQEFTWVQLFDGRRSLLDIQAEAIRQAGGRLLPLEIFTALADRLDRALFLEGPRFRQHLEAPIREPACIGCYEGEPAALRNQLAGLFTHPHGPGRPRDISPDGRLHAALIPHIDYPRGGITYAWGFKEVVERTDASLFVIIGTSHYSACRFTLTRKDFKTPLGIVPTDQGYIDRLVAHYGPGLFDDPLAHLPEHSIELEVVFLQYLYERRRPFRIVPLVVGSFQDCIISRTEPLLQADVACMAEALRRTEAQTSEPICYIISGDLAHIGPKFGDPEPVGEPGLTDSRRRDQTLIGHLEAVDMASYFGSIAAEGDRRRICGLPPTYTLLHGLHPVRGKLLHYGQFVHPRGKESVSFASMAFYR